MRFQVENRSGTAVKYELGGRQFTLPPRVTRTHKQCSEAKIALHLPRGSQIVRAGDGARLAIVRESSGAIAVKRQ